jgi:peptidoglycan hydrolase-like protein with peptidoglycan-binding domain
METSISEYPGSVITKKSKTSAQVKAIHARLKALGYGEGLKLGTFDDVMESAIKLFQSQHNDGSGQALKVDGIVGRFTWLALFGQSQLLVFAPPAALPAQAMAAAISQLGFMELPGQPNRGPQVDSYLKAVGIKNPNSNPPGGYPWCQAFVYWCFEQSALMLARANPSPKTAGVLDHWNKSIATTRTQKISKAAALADITKLQPGMLFVNDYGAGKGHIGYVESIYSDGRLVTVEGNVNSAGRREGLGAFRPQRRKISDGELKGFLDYSRA